jgi:hypothetical protein
MGLCLGQINGVGMIVLEGESGLPYQTVKNEFDSRIA